jgi:hypothetical protein
MGPDHVICFFDVLKDGHCRFFLLETLFNVKVDFHEVVSGATAFPKSCLFVAENVSVLRTKCYG